MGLILRGINKKLGDFTLKGISLEIKRGEYFIILGPCGSGKTLLLSAIAGIYLPDKGEIILGNDNITFSPPEKRGIGYLFQGGHLFPHLSVRENIHYGLRYKKVSREYMDMVFKLLGIDNKLLSRRDILNLSGGEARKVALARSIAIKPRLLLLDEPLVFLDPISQQTVVDSLRAINKNLGITMVHVTHSVYEARELADRIAVLNDGEIMQSGSVGEIIERPPQALLEKYWGRRYVV